MSILRINQACEHFPCHKELEDCTFCYCPLYPCMNEERGGKYLRVGRRRVWDCSECSWIHQKIVVDKIFELIRGKIK